jgi:hypothetical protein
MYYIENGICYLSISASTLMIQWARNICSLKGYKLVYFLEDTDTLEF